jgi:hypothetical protein
MKQTTFTGLILLFGLVCLIIARQAVAQSYQLSRQQLQSVSGTAETPNYRLRHGFGVSDMGSMRSDRFKVGLATRVQQIANDQPVIPSRFVLQQNYPNPFNQSTAFVYDLPHAVQLRLVLYSILGQQVRILYDGDHSAGRFLFLFDGTDSEGSPLSSGLYLLQMIAGGYNQTIKLSIVR